MIRIEGFDDKLRHSHIREIVVERIPSGHGTILISDQSGILAAVRHHDMTVYTGRVVQQMDIAHILETICTFGEGYG